MREGSVELGGETGLSLPFFSAFEDDDRGRHPRLVGEADVNRADPQASCPGRRVRGQVDLRPPTGPGPDLDLAEREPLGPACPECLQARLLGREPCSEGLNPIGPRGTCTDFGGRVDAGLEAASVSRKGLSQACRLDDVQPDSDDHPAP